MKKILALSFNDLRNIFREQILIFMFLVSPIIMFLVARFALPEAGLRYPIIVDYYPLILLLLILQISTGIGFVLASIILDERDEGVLTGIRVMPLEVNTFISYRIFFAMGVSFLTTLLMILGTGLIEVDWRIALGVAFLFSMVAPLVLLALPCFSKNKVEGLAFFKGLNLILLVPAASFFISSKISYLLGIIPLYWTFHFFDAAMKGASGSVLFLLSVLIHLLWIFLLVRLFKKKVFMR